MTMKLLSKSDIDKAKAAQQKRDVDEGLKLARRVDNLRDVAAQEEANLAKFRKEAVAKIHKEVSGLEVIKDKLTGEISQLKRERKELTKPLTDEWAKVHKEKAHLASRSEELDLREVEIAKKERSTDAALKKAADQLAKAMTKDDRRTDMLLDVLTKDQQVTLALKNAREIEAGVLEKQKKVEQELAERDMAMATRERNFEMREANLKESEAELSNEWIRLEDRKAMVEKHIKKST